MPKAMIYLDFNATAPVLPAVVDAVAHALSVTGNPSSVHQHGRQARQLVQVARGHVASAIDAAPEQIVFTSGGTEANNLALRSAMTAAGCDRILIAATEHDSVLAMVADDEPRLPVAATGLLDLDVLDQMLQAGPGRAVVSVMLANNETGVIQPISAIAEICHEHGALLHCDAVQAVGKIPVSFGALGADSMAMTAHKFGGPKGVGALIVKPDLPFQPEIVGGGQEERRRAGTENVASIAGFGEAASRVPELLGHAPRLQGLRNNLQTKIKAMCPAAEIFGKQADRLPNTLCVTMPNVPGDAQVIAFDLEGISVSSGAACSSGKVSVSHVLAAMGIDEDTAKSAIRVSLGPSTSEQELATFVNVWAQLSKQLEAA